MNGGTGRRGGVAGRCAALLGLVGLLLLGGCASSSNADYDTAMQENSALRARIATLQTALDECDTNRLAAESENAELARGLESLRTRNAAASPTGTGFENISGATVSRGAGGSIVVAVAGDVLFDSGKAELKTTSRNSLDRIAQVSTGSTRATSSASRATPTATPSVAVRGDPTSTSPPSGLWRSSTTWCSAA